MLVDLHVHAPPASRDAYDGLDAIGAQCGALGVRAIALTDHERGCDYAGAARTLAGFGVTLVPGRELSTPIGHVLVLTTDVEWLATRPQESALPLDDPPDRPYALVWAHPAGWRVAGAMAAPDPSLGGEHVHAVEVLNGERLYQQDGVRIAEGLARTLGVAATGGSDAHRARSAGRCLTMIPGATDAASVVEGLLAASCAPVLWPAWGEANGIVYRRDDLVGYLPAAETR